jgi:hypothetical protein
VVGRVGFSLDPSGDLQGRPRPHLDWRLGVYAKVFSSLWDGSMRGQSDKQLVFIYLLAHADADGVAEIIQGKIADDTGLREDEVFAALAELMAPDPASRTDGSDGRRLEPLDARGWGWSIVNYQHYRGLRDDETRRQQTREAVRRFRDKKADVSHSKPQKAQGEAEGEGEVDKSTTLSAEADVVVVEMSTKRDPQKAIDRKDWESGFDEFWKAYPKRVNSSKINALKVWMGLMPKDYSTADDLFTDILGALEESKKAWRLLPDEHSINHHEFWLKKQLWRNDAQ